MLSELLPAQALPAGVNRVKLVLGRGTELAQVAIRGGRSGPACLARGPAARANSLAGFLPGTNRGGVLGSIGVAGTSSRLVWRYCVAGGGQFVVVFPRRGGASLIATTARGYRLGGHRFRRRRPRRLVEIIRDGWRLDAFGQFPGRIDRLLELLFEVELGGFQQALRRLVSTLRITR